VAQHSLLGLGRLIVELSIWHTDRQTDRHTTLSRAHLEEWSARRKDLYLTTHTIPKGHTFMPPCPRRHSKQQSHQTSGGRPTPYTALPPRSTVYVIRIGFAQQEPLRDLTSLLVYTDSTMPLLLINSVVNCKECLPFNTNNQKHYSRRLIHGCV